MTITTYHALSRPITTYHDSLAAASLAVRLWIDLCLQIESIVYWVDGSSPVIVTTQSTATSVMSKTFDFFLFAA